MASWFRYTTLLIILSGLFSCQSKLERWQQTDVSAVELAAIEIRRYDQAIFNINPENFLGEIESISSEFPVFLDVDLNDTLNLIELFEYINDPFMHELFDAVSAQYPHLYFLKEELTRAFRFYKYYYPQKEIPLIYTYISGLDFELPVGYSTSDMIIALDVYLGKDFPPYQQMGLPKYMIGEFDRKYITRDCFEEIALFELSGQVPGETLLDRMIHEGKILYFLDAMLPDLEDEIKIGYSPDQLEWCIDSESDLWKFIIENDLLYSTDIQIINKLFNPGPFTRGFDGSPSRLGIWMGWQITRAYMNKNTDISLQELFANPDAKQILAKSAYKPRVHHTR